MASSIIFLSFFLTLSLHVFADNPNDLCPASFCHPQGPEIRFPFRVRDVQNEQCGYPGFDLSCDNRSQAILHLPDGQDFVVDLIDYKQQYVMLKDPSNCLLKRLQNSRFSSWPFVVQEYETFELANCSVDILSEAAGIKPVGCLSDAHNVVMLHAAGDAFDYWWFFEFKCRTWTMSIPVAREYLTDITEGVPLKWSLPDCISCQENGGRCRLKGTAGYHVRCHGKDGLSKAAKFGIILGVILPSLLSMFQIACYLRSRDRVSSRHDHYSNQPPDGNNGENNVTNVPSPSSPSREAGGAPGDVTGLDLVTLKSYPKSKVDDDGRVPSPSDNICAICLSEYRPKEMLRTMPMCGHYFHEQCVDRWLEQKASCPLCRENSLFLIV